MHDGRRPLDGIRVLELAQIVAGPFCGALMAEFGAEVIKVEMPGRGDDVRRMGPSEGDVGYWWAVENRNKKAMTLDLHHPKGQEIVRRLVPHVDVVTAKRLVLPDEVLDVILETAIQVVGSPRISATERQLVGDLAGRAHGLGRDGLRPRALDPERLCNAR